MSLLTIIQDVCDNLGIPRPTTVIGNTDQQVIQLVSIANQEGKNLASRYAWSSLIRVNTFTMLLAELQGALNSTVVTAGDFDYILNDTIWNRTLSEPIFGPAGAVERQTLAAFPVTGPYQKFWILAGSLYINPAPTTADTGAFEYKSTFWCQSAGGTGQAKWASDHDVGKLSEDLMTLGIMWRWLQRKGLDYAEDFNIYESRVSDAMARDGGKPRLNLGASPYDRIPGVIVPQGNWYQ